MAKAASERNTANDFYKAAGRQLGYAVKNENEAARIRKEAATEADPIAKKEMEQVAQSYMLAARTHTDRAKEFASKAIKLEEEEAEQKKKR